MNQAHTGLSVEFSAKPSWSKPWQAWCSYNADLRILKTAIEIKQYPSAVITCATNALATRLVHSLTRLRLTSLRA